MQQRSLVVLADVAEAAASVAVNVRVECEIRERVAGLARLLLNGVIASRFRSSPRLTRYLSVRNRSH